MCLSQQPIFLCMFFYFIYQALKWAIYTQFYHSVAFCTSLYFKMISKSLLSHSYKFRPYSTLKVIKLLFCCLLTTQLKICFSKPIRCQALLLFSNKEFFWSFKVLHPSTEVWIRSLGFLAGCQLPNTAVFTHKQSFTRQMGTGVLSQHNGKNCAFYYFSLFLPAQNTFYERMVKKTGSVRYTAGSYFMKIPSLGHQW